MNTEGNSKMNIDMRSLRSIAVGVIAAATLAACSSGAPAGPQTTSPQPTDGASQGPSGQEPVLDITEVYGKGPGGETAASYSDLELTDQDKEKLKAGNFSVALNFHQLDNAVNYNKLQVAKSLLEENGVKVIATTDANSDANKLSNDVETTIGLKPDLIVSIAYDASANRPIFEKARDAGIKLVFMETAPNGFVGGKDYAALVSTDYTGNGRFAAEYLAYLMNYKGTVGVVYLDADLWSCNVRDQAFRDVIAKYPDMEIVADKGFAEIDKAGSVADAILAQFPDVDAMYSTWDTPAEQIMASAKAVGRDDLLIATVDLGENTARVIAEGGMIKAVGAPRSHADGVALAMSAMYALIDKPLPSTFIGTPTMGAVQSNVLDAYKASYSQDPDPQLVAVWEQATGKKWQNG